MITTFYARFEADTEEKMQLALWVLCNLRLTPLYLSLHHDIYWMNDKRYFSMMGECANENLNAINKITDVENRIQH